MMKIQEPFCEWLMRRFPVFPSVLDKHLWEVFKSNYYLKNSAYKQSEIRHSITMASFDYESNPRHSWLVKYFSSRVPLKSLERATLLDLGCFTGGRLAYWTKNYRLKTGLGIDINPEFKLAADEFNEKMCIPNVLISTGYGEALPYENDSIDFIVATDVFEHVRNLFMTLLECHRVLKPGGKLLAVFPQYLQPLEAHLGLVTWLPALHWFFSGKVISRCYNKIILERPDSDWYAPSYPLQDWELLPSLNGTSVRTFKRLVRSMDWTEVDFKAKPILTDGRRANSFPFKQLSMFCAIPARIPYLEELFLGRINCVLVK